MTWTSRVLLACGILLLGSSGLVVADPGDVLLTVKNDYDSPIGVWVRSEKNQNPNPWVNQTIQVDGNAQFTLRSPDRYIIVVDAGNQRSRSKPVELKSFLTKHPKYVMNLRAKITIGEVAGAGAGQGAELEGGVGPGQGDQSDATPEYLGLDFAAEPQGN